MSDLSQEAAPLASVEERVIAFYEDEIIAVAVEEDGQRRIYVPMRPIVEYLGLTWSSQYMRIQRDLVLSEVMRSVLITRTERGERELVCLPIEFLNGWLFGLQPTRVHEALREKIVRYQRECYRVLWDAFRSQPVEPALGSEAFMAAMRDNARQQMELWSTLLQEQRRLRAAEGMIQEHDAMLMDAFRELDALRQEQSRLGARFSDLARLLPAPSDPIGPAQKAALKELVDDLVAAAQERGVRLGQGRNDYPAVWGAFKQRFDVAKYDELTGERYDEALTWLKTWIDRVRAS